VSEGFSGSNLAATSSWSSDSNAVATVEASTGRVTGVANGGVLISVDSGGRRGTKQIRVLPNFQGTWSGSYVVSSCSATGQIAGGEPCSTFSPNAVLPMNMVNTLHPLEALRVEA
jgi:hypothetical protein